MKTLAIISHKGGAGKTSSTVMLADELSRRGFRVLVVDADRQRGCSLLMGIVQRSGRVQQAGANTWYYCSADLHAEEIPAKARELTAWGDVALVDTPSLDDPLAQGWLRAADAALLVMPVEPISVRTLPGADEVLEAVRIVNPGFQLLGILPTLFNENDRMQRAFLGELISRRQETILATGVPVDPNLAHHAAEHADARTRPSQSTRHAYSLASDHIVQALSLNAGPEPDAPVVSIPKPSGPYVWPEQVTAAAPGSGRSQSPAPTALLPAATPRWLIPAAALSVVLTLCVGLWFGWMLGAGSRAAEADSKPSARARQASKKATNKATNKAAKKKPGKLTHSAARRRADL
jgi:cellulose biosynthesis protein BcsQ